MLGEQCFCYRQDSAGRSGVFRRCCGKPFFTSQGIEYELFDQVENKPILENVGAGDRGCQEFQAGLYLGYRRRFSPDASKAVAVLWL